mmetsp:Transcript_36270/g.94742  ORF Transcript_36270/g.94742 Transcript_36270/m.94742 type:complete len:211 (-) Transcript_36270:139-771(-)
MMIGSQMHLGPVIFLLVIRRGWRSRCEQGRPRNAPTRAASTWTEVPPRCRGCCRDRRTRTSGRRSPSRWPPQRLCSKRRPSTRPPAPVSSARRAAAAGARRARAGGRRRAAAAAAATRKDAVEATAAGAAALAATAGDTPWAPGPAGAREAERVAAAGGSSARTLRTQTTTATSSSSPRGWPPRSRCTATIRGMCRPATTRNSRRSAGSR